MIFVMQAAPCAKPAQYRIRENILQGSHLCYCVCSDHRKLGAELNLFSINDMGGAGLVFWHPKVRVSHWHIHIFLTMLPQCLIY